jgi:hypothetical protein
VPATHREQFNVEVSPRLMLIAKQLALIEGASVPQLLRPVLEDFLERRVQESADLSAAVDAVERAWQARDREGASVTPIASKTREPPVQG